MKIKVSGTLSCLFRCKEDLHERIESKRNEGSESWKIAIQCFRLTEQTICFYCYARRVEFLAGMSDINGGALGVWKKSNLGHGSTPSLLPEMSTETSSELSTVPVITTTHVKKETEGRLHHCHPGLADDLYLPLTLEMFKTDRNMVFGIPDPREPGSFLLDYDVNFLWYFCPKRTKQVRAKRRETSVTPRKTAGKVFCLRPGTDTVPSPDIKPAQCWQRQFRTGRKLLLFQTFLVSLCLWELAQRTVIIWNYIQI